MREARLKNENVFIHSEQLLYVPGDIGGVRRLIVLASTQKWDDLPSLVFIHRSIWPSPSLGQKASQVQLVYKILQLSKSAACAPIISGVNCAHPEVYNLISVQVGFGCSCFLSRWRLFIILSISQQRRCGDGCWSCVIKKHLSNLRGKFTCVAGRHSVWSFAPGYLSPNQHRRTFPPSNSSPRTLWHSEVRPRATVRICIAFYYRALFTFV